MNHLLISTTWKKITSQVMPVCSDIIKAYRPKFAKSDGKIYMAGHYNIY